MKSIHYAFILQPKRTEDFTKYMTKRKLTQQQRQRIKQAHDLKKNQCINSHKKDNKINKLGLVIASYGHQVIIETNSTSAYYQIINCTLRSSLPAIIAGDNVIWRAGNEPNKGIIEALIPRKSALFRSDYRKKLKPIAANIDCIIIVVSPKPVLSEYLLDRYLVAAHAIGVKPIILLNKIDLLKTEALKNSINNKLLVYKKLDYDIILCSIKNAVGIDLLKLEMKNKNSIFVGQSGVGKSSLIQLLVPDVDIKVGALSIKSDQGKHTTTTTTLYHLASGGSLIDSPGIRTFALWHMSQDYILQGFKELYRLSLDCRFRNCQHDKEQGCAIQQALIDGSIDPKRWCSYLNIIQSSNG